MTETTGEFYVTGGSLRGDASSYVVREADEELYDALVRREFSYILTSRQMGKSSLMIRTAARLREAGIRVVVLDLTAIGQNLTVEQWYDGLLLRLAQQLDLEDELEAFWLQHERFGPMQRFMAALREVVLSDKDETGARVRKESASSVRLAPTAPLVLFVDEIDIVRSLPFSSDEFFAAIRECYNRRAQDARFERLTFCLLGVAAPTDLIRNTQMTPFNVGRRIELSDFTEAEASPLAEGFPAPLQHAPSAEERNRLLQRVLYWTGGHPYLTQRLCRTLAEHLTAETPEHPDAALVDRLCEELFLSTQARERDDNLIFVRERLLRSDEDRAGLLDLYGQVRAHKRVPNDETNARVALLRLSGVVRPKMGALEVRNRIYERVFDSAWIRENMPHAELRRQRQAFKRGVARTLVIAGTLFALLVGGVLLSRHQTHLRIRRDLPDGTTFTLEDVTYGKTHHFEAGPFRWQGLMPGNHTRPVVTDTDCLCAWISHQDRKKENIFGLDNVVAFDEHGCRFESRGNLDNYVDAYCFAAFPRRGKTVNLRLFDFSGRGPITDFTIPNPAPVLYPLWTPEPLPDSKESGDLTVTLTGLRTLRDLYCLAANNFYLVPEFRFDENGKPTDAWEADGRETLKISDATGNESNTRPCSLCIHEPAWKLRAQFYRKNTASFAAGETWTIKGVPVPLPGKGHTLSSSTTLHGASLKVTHIAGAGVFSYTDTNGILQQPIRNWQNNIHRGPEIEAYSGGERLPQGRPGGVDHTGGGPDQVSSPSPHVRIVVDSTLPGYRLTVWATDKSGRRFNAWVLGQTWESGGGNGKSVYGKDPMGEYYIGLSIPVKVTSVDLHFAVQSPRTAEFMIKPPLPPRK